MTLRLTLKGWTFVGLAVCLAAAAPTPNAPSQPPSKASQQNAAGEQRGTEVVPPIAKVLEAEKTEQELGTEKDQENAEADPEQQMVTFTRDLALYTEGLFIATALLALATGGLVFLGFRQVSHAGKTIKATEASVDAIKITEMARIMVTRITLPDLRPGRDKPPKFRVHFHNFGKTPGFIHRTTLHFSPAEKGTALESLFPNARGGSYDNGFPIPPTPPTEISQPAVDDDGDPLPTPESGKPATDQYGTAPITAQELEAMTQRKAKLQLFVWGEVEFSPVFEEHWISKFAYRVNLSEGAGQKCVEVGGADYWRYYKADKK